MVTRRQFGLWAAAAMVVAPTAAHAGKKAGRKTTLGHLALTGTVGETTDKNIAIDIQAVNSGSDGLMVELHAVSAVLTFGEQEAPIALMWMNDEYPLSRRMVTPSFVDIPAGPPMLAGRFNLEVADGLKDKSDGLLKIVLAVVSQEGETIEVALEPISLAKTSKENS